MSTTIVPENGDCHHSPAATGDATGAERQLHIAEAITLAARLPEALQETGIYVEQLAARAAQLERQTCTGVPYWRDQDAPGRRPKLYLVHGVGQPCPLHGAPAPGRRLRTYIGVDPHRQQAAFAALERHTHRQHLLAERQRLAWALRDARIALRRLLRDLGYDPDTPLNTRRPHDPPEEDLPRPPDPLRRARP